MENIDKFLRVGMIGPISPIGLIKVTFFCSFLVICGLVGHGRRGSDIIAVVLKAINNRLKPLFPMLEIFQHDIDFIHQVA